MHSSRKNALHLGLATLVALGLAVRPAAAQYSLTTLTSFNGTNGQYPQSPVVRDAQGNLYGLSQVLFDLPVGGTPTAAAIFGSPNGISPMDSLLLAPDGSFYGTTQGGGANRVGTVFRYTPGKGLTTLYSFTAVNGEGGAPAAGLTMDAAGNLYGTTKEGGLYNDGTLFELSPTPEPSQAAALVVGMLGLTGLAFKARKRQSAE